MAARLSRRSLLTRTAATAALAGAPLAARPAEIADGPGRERLLLDFGWRFALGHAHDQTRDFGFGADQRTYAKAGTKVAAATEAGFDDSDWRPVQLPHDWAVDLPFAPSRDLDPTLEEDPRAAHGFKPLGREYPGTSVGWYRKTFALAGSDDGRRLSLEFDGVFRDCLVLVNGYVAHRHEGGYGPFRVEIGDFAVYGGDNQIALRVDASLGEGWFYEGAGVYRHVWLVKTDPLHVPQWGVFVRSVVEGGAARLTVETQIANQGDAPRRGRLVSTVLDPDSRAAAVITSEVDLAGWGATTVNQSAELPRPRLWSIEDPALYRLRTELIAGGVTIDRTETPFGFRTLRFDAEQGFFLNGRPLKLLGTCNHQDHAGVGAAVPDRLQEFRIEKLKAMGSNAYRAAHNPPAAELLDACDRLGMVVIDETRRMSSDPAAMAELEALVRRDRNHPCVILWSLGNEEQQQQATARGARIIRAMKRLVTRLDDTRPTMAAVDGGFGEGISKVVDVLGFNYRTDQMEAYHRKVPHQPILGSETGSTVATRGAYGRDDARHILPAYDREHPWWASTAEAWWTIAADRPYIAGGFIWTGFDYRGEPTPFNQFPSISSYFGVMDTCGFPKDNYYYYRAWWRPEPLLHLFPHWTWPGREGEPIEVWCHTNLARVELFLNGVSQGVRDVPRNRHVSWTVPYRPGELTALGRAADGQRLKASRQTASAPARIVLSPDRVRIRGDGEDVSVITAAIVDARGRPAPTASTALTFAIAGPGRVIGVGNGDPTSLEPDQGASRSAFNGLAMVLVQAADRPGRIVVEATAPGLAGARAEIFAMAARRRPSA